MARGDALRRGPSPHGDLVPRAHPRTHDARRHGAALSGTDLLFSVIVPTRGDDSKLLPLLDALDRQTIARFDWELVVAFDGARPSAIATRRLADCGARSVPLPERRGPGAARNAAAREAMGAWLAFTEDDCSPATDWLERAAHVARTGGADVIEGETTTPTGAPVRRRTGWTPNFLPTNLFVERKVFVRVGGYCEGFYDATRGIYFREDSDFGFRLEASGARIVVDPTIRVLHPVEHSSLLDPLRWARRYQMDVLLERRHPARFRERIEVTQLGPLRVRRLVLRASFAFVITLGASLAAFLLGEGGLAVLFASAAALCFLTVWAKWRFAPARLLVSLLVPFVLVGSYLRGFGYARRTRQAAG